MLEIFSYSFMQRAFIAGNVIAIIAPIIGVFLNMMRLSMMGHTLSHVALAGVALGIFLGFPPLYMALIVTIGAALAIEKLKESFKDYAEISLAIILAAGLGLTTILVSLSHSNTAIFSYLFGSISLVTRDDLYIVIPLGMIILSLTIIFYNGFFFLAFNEDEAKMAGVPVRALTTIFMIMVAVVVSLSMRIVGGLLISSLIILPVAAAMQIATSLKNTIFLSILISLVSVNSGILISFYWDLAPGGTIILSAVFCLVVLMIHKKVKLYIKHRSMKSRPY